VKSISFALDKGKTLGIVGESGSGKSVSALSILRLLPKELSTINADGIYLKNEGEEINLLSVSEREIRAIRGKRVSMIFQEPMTSMNPVVRCGKQVTEAIRTHENVNVREARKMALELFKEVQLPRPEAIYQSYPHELSGGQKQRVMIAMAISSQPDILIADEPTTALDVTVQKAILELLRNLQKKYGMAILFITHDLGVISAIANDIIVMKDGEIVESGPVESLLKTPGHPYTRGLLACRPRMDINLERLPTVKDFLSGDDKNQEITSFIQNYKKKKRYQEKRKPNHTIKPVLKVSLLKTQFPVRSGNIFEKKTYINAVNKVSLDIYPGETVGLVGESGCGKTTLGRSLLRLVEPKSGEMTFQGKKIMDLSGFSLRKMRKNLQIIFQDPYSSLNPRITAGKAIMEPMIVHKLYVTNDRRKDKVLELMEKVGLEKTHFNRYPHEFSGGQRQRICIARALATEPDVIICDESVSALDVSVQAQVLNLLNDLKKEFGLTYLFISHDLSVVKFMANRIIVMKDGKIEESGYPEKIFKKPKSPYTKKLIDALQL
jgi:peptide/nickel transport system ATP-binding protein